MKEATKRAASEAFAQMLAVTAMLVIASVCSLCGEVLSTVIARSEATTRLRLLRKLRRAGSPPKLGERRRKQSSSRFAAP